MAGFTNGGGVLQSKASGTTFSGNVAGLPGEIIFCHSAHDNLTASTPTATIAGKPAGETNDWSLLFRINSPQSGAGAGIVQHIWYIKPTVSWSGVSCTVTYSGAIGSKTLAFFRLQPDAGMEFAGDPTSTSWGSSASIPAGFVTDNDLICGFGASEQAYSFGALGLSISGPANTAVADWQGGTTGGSSATNVYELAACWKINTGGTGLTLDLVGRVDSGIGVCRVIQTPVSGPSADMYCGIPI